MVIAHKQRRHVHAYRLVSSIERQVRRLGNHHPLVAVGVALVMVALFFVVMLVRVIITVAVKTVTVAVRLTITITLVVCRNIFRTFPA